MSNASVKKNSSTEESRQYLSFMLAGETYAVSILYIKEILEYGSLTTVPMMPDFLRGVINLRGAVVPVIDLNARFGHGRSAVGKRTCVVIIEMVCGERRQDLGIIVDAVNEVLDIDQSDMEPTPNFGTKIRTDFIAGMVRRENRFLIVLNVNRVLSLDEMELLASVTGTEPVPANAA